MSRRASVDEIERLVSRHASSLPELDRLRAILQHPDAKLTRSLGALPAQHFLDIYRVRREIQNAQGTPRPWLLHAYDRFLQHLQSCESNVGLWTISFPERFFWSVFEDDDGRFLGAFDSPPPERAPTTSTPQTIFDGVPWFADVGNPTTDAAAMGTLPELRRRLAEEPDAVFAPPYTNPYEFLCVADHNVANTFHQPSNLQELVKTAYLKAFEFVPVPEFAGLISDDVETIAILSHCGVLTGFSQERFTWYRRGRVPWGYSGTYPEGRWIVW